MEHAEKTLTAGDGLSLYYQGWDPGEPRRALVCLVHGIGEHSGRYRHVAQHFNQAQLALAAIDLRGHGKSAGPRGHTPNYQALMDDIDLLLVEAQAQYPGLPCFLYGHSLGGNLVLNYGLRTRPQLAGVIASAPALRLAFDPPPLKAFLGRMMDRLYPSFSQASGLDTSALSRDPEVERRYKDDPRVHDIVSARLFMGILEAGKWALAHAGEWTLPALVMHGSADQLSLPSASREFAESAGPHVVFKSWEGLFHEIHNEYEQVEVMDFMVAWMNKRLAEINL